MQKTTFIYALCEPGTRTVRYIGKSDDLKRRFREHLRCTVKEKTPVGEWLRTGVIPELVILREVVMEEWEVAEERYIRLARGCGMNLLNSSDGGEGVTMTPEVCRKISVGNSGKVRTPEAKERYRAARTGTTLSPGICSKISSAHLELEKTVSVEARAHLSEINIGEGSPFFGEKHTEASREKIRVARSKQVISSETRAKMSESHIARHALRKLRDQEIEWALAPYTLE